MLQPLADLALQPLEWKCVGVFTDSSWDLWATTTRLGGLRLGAMRMSGTAEVGSAHWKLYQVGILGGQIRMRADGAKVDAAVFSKKWYRGRVKLETGRELEWGPTNFWATRWAFTSENRQVVLEFRRKGWLGRAMTVTVAPESRGAGDLGVLLVLGQFLMIRRAQAH